MTIDHIKAWFDWVRVEEVTMDFALALFGVSPDIRAGNWPFEDVAVDATEWVLALNSRGARLG